MTIPEGGSAGGGTAFGSRPVADAAAALHRWVQAGGTWQLLVHTPTRAVIALCTCSGDEEVERISTEDPAVLARLAGPLAGQEF